MGPAALLRKPDRRREMVERDDRCKSSRPTTVDHAFVVVEHRYRELTRIRFDTCPFKREAIAVQPDLSYKIEILRPEFEAVESITRTLDIECRFYVFGEP